jgi:GNAT superfamily N-acetyltransferase
MQVTRFEREWLPGLLDLVNLHLSAVVPGWAFSGAFLAEHLERNRTEPITDPWVEERETLCAVEGGKVLAAAHLLRYGGGPEVGEHYRGAGEIDWFLSLPDRPEAAAGVLEAARQRMAEWEVAKEYGWSNGFPTVPMLGVPDRWPHVAAALLAAGFRPPELHTPESLYAGRLDGVPNPEPPLAGLTLRRTAGVWAGARFSALREGEEVGFCEVEPDLTQGGLLPALGGWAELQEMWVREGERSRGVGSWLAGCAASWLVAAGCDRVVLCVAADDEAAGAGRFYRRLGWDVISREIRAVPSP